MEPVCFKALHLKSGFRSVFVRNWISNGSTCWGNGRGASTTVLLPALSILQPSKTKERSSHHCDEEILPGSNGEIRPCHDADMRTYLELTLQSDIWIDLPK